MKRILTKLKIKANLIILAVLAVAMASCDSVLDFDKGDCTVEYRVRFKYDYNMKFADAFANEVSTVTLYAFDDNGNLVYQKMEAGEALKTGDYTMQVDVAPGEYHLVAWAGLNNESFAIPLLREGESNIDQLTVKTNRTVMTRANGEEENIVNDKLFSLWHAESVQSFTRAASGKERIITLNLVKNTNVFRIILNQMDGVDIDIDSFDFSIYDDNGWMNYDNQLLKDDLLTYKPYSTSAGTTTRADVDGGNTPIGIAIAQLSVARILANQHPTLRITNKKTGEVAVQISLIKYLRLLRMQEYENMSDQEYFDRQDEYSMTFFLDSNMTWLKTVIEINGWTIRLNDSNL